MIYNIVYCTTNLVDGKQYVGIHTTINLDDGYLGSGRLFQEAVNKYGEENFDRKILFKCDTREEAMWLESIIMSNNIVYRWGGGIRFYNLIKGGVGLPDSNVWSDYNVFRRKLKKRKNNYNKIQSGLYAIRLKTLYPNLRLLSVFRGSNKPVHYQCVKCKKKFRACPSYIEFTGCENCN